MDEVPSMFAGWLVNMRQGVLVDYVHQDTCGIIWKLGENSSKTKTQFGSLYARNIHLLKELS